MSDSAEDAQAARGRHAHVPEERRATEYLANERTFLAWIRTSIAVISIGFALTHLSVEPTSINLKFGSSATSIHVGIVLMGFGALLAVLAVWRYESVNRAIHRGKVKADRFLIFLVTAVVVFLALGAIFYTAFVER